MSTLPGIVIVGGHGKVARLLTRLASPSYTLTSLIRSPSQSQTISQLNSTPKIISLEDCSLEELEKEFEGCEGILFSAGAGGKGGKEMTKKIDQLGAIKVFDAIERIEKSVRPKLLIVVGALDTRDMSKPPPSHYTERDITESRKVHEAIGTYYDCKLAAYENLSKRREFDWIELRPGHLKDEEGNGMVKLGRTGMGSVNRQDVAATILSLFNNALQGQQKEDKRHVGLTIDLIQGDQEIEKGVKEVLASVA